jgi:hypothetical protein
MALGSIKEAREVYAQHDFSRNHQIRILDMAGVPDYVRNELLYKPAGQGGAVYATSIIIPGREIKDIVTTYQGFDFHSPGMVQYTPNPWTISFRTPGDYLVRNAFEQWSFDTVSDETTCGAFKFPCPGSSIDLAILSPGCTIERVYRLIGVYPQSVGQIQYNLENNETTTFDVSLHYQYWRLVNNNDSGSIDTDNSDRALIDSTYAGYGAKIQANNTTNCATPV